MIKIYCLKTNLNLSEKIFNSLLLLLNRNEKNKILRYIRYEDRIRGLFGKLLLFWILKKEFNMNRFPMLYFDKYNRPYQKENQDLDFNISHSGEWVVCGISDSGRVGIDVEKIKPISLDIAKNYFKGNEYETIVKRDGKEKLSCFFHFWTLKEAYLKAEGSTFLIPLDKFWFDISNFSNPQFSCMKNFYYTLNYKFNSYRIDNGYILSLCCKCKNIKNNPYTLLQFEDIVDFYSKFIYYY